MFTRIVNQLRSQYLGAIALFLVLAGGTSYAAVKLTAGSVHTRQLHDGAVTNQKLAKHSVGAVNLDRKSIAGYVRAYAQISPSGQLVVSRPGAHLIYWNTTGSDPGGLIDWNQSIPASCFALASTTGGGVSPFYASAEFATAGKNASTLVQLSADQGPGDIGPGVVNVAVMCPQP